MKKIFISIALLASISLASSAQTKEGNRGDKNTRLVKELNLSDDQQKKVDKLDSEYKVKIDELRGNESLTKQ